MVNEILNPKDLGRDVGFILTSFMEQFSKKIANEVIEYFESQNETEKISCEIVSSNSDELLSITQVCKILKVSRVTLNKYKKIGYLTPDTYVGNSPRYNNSSIEDFLKRNGGEL